MTCASPEFVGRPRRRELRDRPNAFLRGAGAGDGKSAVARERSGNGGSEVASRPAAPYVRLPPVRRSAARALSRGAWVLRGRCPAGFGFGPARRSAYVAHGSVLSFGGSDGPNAGRSERDDRRKEKPFEETGVRSSRSVSVGCFAGRFELCGSIRTRLGSRLRRFSGRSGKNGCRAFFRCLCAFGARNLSNGGAGYAVVREMRIDGWARNLASGPSVGDTSKADTEEPYRSVPGRDSDGLSGREGEYPTGNPEAAGVGIAFRGMPFPLPEFAMG